MEPQAQTTTPGKDTVSALTSGPTPISQGPPPGQGLVSPTGQQSQAGVVQRAPSLPLRQSGCSLPASDAFCGVHLPASVFMFSSLMPAVKILAFESCCHNNHFITRQAQYLRNAESFLKSVCAAHQRGIGAHYFYIILQANRYFPIHISFLS